MKVYLVRAHHNLIEGQSYTVGIFSSGENATKAIETEKMRMGDAYNLSCSVRHLDNDELDGMKPTTDTVSAAWSAETIQCAQRLLGPKPTHYAIFDSDPEVSLEERTEALEQYMNVAQMKIMALQSNVDFLLYTLRNEIGEEETKRRMDQVINNFGRMK